MNVKKILAEAIIQAMHKAMEEGLVNKGEVSAPVLDVPPQKEFGDFATNFAMQTAKSLRMNPRLLAQVVIDKLECPYVAKAEIAGPGFINFYLKEDWLYATLREVLLKGEHYGSLERAEKAKVQIEFVSANPTGPLHVGHGRGAAVGSALANLLLAAGFEVEREYYINDAGNQMEILAASVNARYLELLGKKCEFPANGYHGKDIIETAERIIKIHGDKFLQMEEEVRLEEFKTLALKEKMAALKEDLAAFNVEFDVWFSEKTLHEADKIKAVCDVLLAQGDMYEKDGALWLKSTAYGDDKDRVVIRENGVPTYLAADIAYHLNKLERGYDHLINLWGADHHGYIARMKAAVAALGYAPEKLEVLILQMVSLYRNGELVKMSKRTGQSVTLSELIEEVGTDAARYFFIMRSIDSQLDFDLTLATEKSSDNPVYYVQYAHARITSILKQMEETGIAIDAEAPLTMLTQPIEIDLIKKLSEYPELIEVAARERAPHRIAHYVYDLAGLFHSFYNQCRILGVEKDLQQARLLLITAVRNVVRHALAILGISAPEKM
ncbi:MAG TPA: arginine--tRNA ligase [Candidatus Avacidaminococcus intestinavium]|uniref:Arginine--tRNA ligase n=1 Tax=Candidatus Avacidaminococcus intestinavium TaxID=2840684 RepID=A0A9D1MPD6_9FIRM|nr:arginine--tRNA ligase [Candidatus Avacidaminococcus intestinavium]